MGTAQFVQFELVLVPQVSTNVQTFPPWAASSGTLSIWRPICREKTESLKLKILRWQLLHLSYGVLKMYILLSGIPLSVDNPYTRLRVFQVVEIVCTAAQLLNRRLQNTRLLQTTSISDRYRQLGGLATVLGSSALVKDQ
jgi:hypothetical protein